MSNNRQEPAKTENRVQPDLEHIAAQETNGSYKKEKDGKDVRGTSPVSESFGFSLLFSRLQLLKFTASKCQDAAHKGAEILPNNPWIHWWTAVPQRIQSTENLATSRGK